MTKDEILQLTQRDRLRRVLILTALPLEMKAVRAHLTHLGSVPGRSGTVYECGRFSGRASEWLVVVAESGAGTHAAQGAVSAAHMEFESFEAVLFVGIGGSRKEDAPIGSVVASSNVYFPYSGKIDPELGFTSRPHSIPIDPHLVGYARKVARDEEWVSRICAPLKMKLPLDDVYPQPYPPAAFIAPIASIEAVSADPKSDLEALISKHYSDAHVVEMEGYGAAYAAYSERTPLIIIRGISDMRGGKTAKNDAIHQPVAAAHAAAFAFELIALWGEYKPLQGPPAQPPVTTIGTTPPVPQHTPAPVPSDGSGRRTLVLSFAGIASDFPSQKVEEIVAALRTIADDPNMALVGTEEGTFRIMVDARKDALEKLRSPDSHISLLRDHGVSLLGVLDEREYRRVLTIEGSLEHASRDLLDWPQDLPGGAHLQRPELEQVLSIFGELEHSTTVLLGDPGSGKSALLAAVGQELRSRKTPFLAIKADLLDPNIQTEADLSQSLGLSGAVSDVLIRLSHLRPVALLIDQLDALAGYVDLRTGRLSILLNVVRKLGGRRNIHILLSARTFEFSHDTRLKTVRAESITLALPPWSDVLKVLEHEGVQAAGWPVDAQDVMRVPQSLATFLKLKDRANAQPFRKYQVMLDQLWKERLTDAPNGSQLAKLATTIAETMAETESLWLAASRFDDQAETLRALVATGLLTDYDGSGGRIGFSHQTVFEHALARSFARGPGRLSTYVLDRQASLFVRPKLWAALTYLRDIETPTYHTELETIWVRKDLRAHLRHMLIEFMGQQPSPTSIEDAFFKQALASENRQVALQAMIGSPGWFKACMPMISDSMTVDAEAPVASAILDKAWSFAPDAVKSLIAKQWQQKPAFDSYAWQVLQDNPKWDDESTEIAKSILARSEIAPMFFEHAIAIIGVDQPETALKLIAARLSRKVSESKTNADALSALTPPDNEEERMVWLMTHSSTKPITDTLEHMDGLDSLGSIAKNHPALFLRYVWPIFVSALHALRSLRDGAGLLGFSLQHHLDFRFPGENALSLPEPPLLGALVAAVEALATQDEKAFLAWLSENEHEDASPAQRLYARGLTTVPERYAERAAKFLLDDKRRFYLGNISDYQSTTKALVAAASPFWSDELLAHFAAEVTAFSPPPPDELDAQGRLHLSEMVRREKLGVFNTLPFDRLPKNIQRHIEEERRRFPNDKIGAVFHGPGWIGSPMSRQSMEKAADDDIINAFRELPDKSAWDHPKQWMKGGNIQLSREFAEFAKSHPNRAVRLIRRFEPQYGSRASGYAIDTMSETADPKVILDLIVDLDQRGFCSPEFRDGVARGVERLIRRDVHIPDNVLTVLESWLPVPREERNESGEGEKPSLKEKDKDEASEGSILWGIGGLSTLPNGNYPILETITRVLISRNEHDRLLDLYSKHLPEPEDPRVWQALMRFFRYIHPGDPSRLGQFVLELLQRRPELATVRETAVMLAFMQWRLPNVVRTAIASWQTTQEGMLQQAYGEIVGLIALSQPALQWPSKLLSEILKTPELVHARVGAAYAAVNLWQEAGFRAGASEVLQAIIPQADERAWSAIFDLFRVVDEITPEPEWVSLLEVMAEHMPATPQARSTFVVDRLQTLLPHQAPLVARIAKRIVANWRAELGDRGAGTALAARDLVDVAITLHRLGPDTREIGTALFEDLLFISAYTAQETLHEIDNRFRSTPAPARRRLPRRQPRARRA